MYHARVLAASHSIYGRVVTEGALLYTDCPKNASSLLLQGQPARPRGMIRFGTTSPPSPTLQPLPSSSVLTLESGPSSRCDGLARAWDMQGNAPNSRARTVSVSTGFRCTPVSRIGQA